MGIPSADMYNRAKWTALGVRISLSTSSARNTAALGSGKLYTLTSSVDCFVLQGGSGVTATIFSTQTDGSNFLPAGVPMGPFLVESSSDAYFAGITESGTGYLYVAEWTT